MGRCIPAQGATLGREVPRVWRSVGTPHIPKCLDRTGVYAAFLQNALILWGHTQGYTLGWYELPRWGRGVRFFG